MASPEEVLCKAVEQHRSGNLKAALAGYRSVLKKHPRHGSARHGEGLALEALGRLPEAQKALRKAAETKPASALFLFNLARVEAHLGEHDAALAAYLEAVSLKPDFADAWNNLGMLLGDRHQLDEAEQALRNALNAAPGHRPARVNLARLLCGQRRRTEASVILAPVLQGLDVPAEAHFLQGTIHEDETRYAAALDCYHKALANDPGLIKAHNNIGTTLLGLQRYDEARNQFFTMFEGKRGQPRSEPGPFREKDWAGPKGTVLRTCRARLEDMAQQLRFLVADETLDPSWERAAKMVDAAMAWHDQQGLAPEQPHAMTGRSIEAIAGLHERVVRFADSAPIKGPAIGTENDYRQIETGYQASPTSVTVIDNFLSPDALASLRAFCLGSTIYFGHNATGYVTSYMADGFAPSLLYQLAEELQQAMPEVLGSRHLHNMWVYRHRNEGAGVNAHTDDASVTFNFWITNDEASLDQDHGGLVVYAREQPLDWDWHDINLRKNAPDVKAKVSEFLAHADPVTIPHRANRAVLFHSNLFHMSDRFRFRDGFENRRTNITLLFGERGA